MFLIDTSAWIFALRRNFHPVIKERIYEILSESDVSTNGMIKLELLGGTRTKQEYNRLKSRLDALNYIEATKSLWDRSAALALDLKSKGVPVPYTDTFIAASAIQDKAILLHVDSHFDTIAQHTSLQVESLVSHI